METLLFLGSFSSRVRGEGRRRKKKEKERKKEKDEDEEEQRCKPDRGLSLGPLSSLAPVRAIAREKPQSRGSWRLISVRLPPFVLDVGLTSPSLSCWTTTTTTINFSLYPPLLNLTLPYFTLLYLIYLDLTFHFGLQSRGNLNFLCTSEITLAGTLAVVGTTGSLQEPRPGSLPRS